MNAAEKRARKCRACKRAIGLRFDTDRNGRVIETEQPCLCRKEWRVAAGLCLDCDEPVEGCVGKALRCSGHKKTAHREAEREWTRTHRDEKNAAWRARYHRRPKMRQRKSEKRKAWRAANPDRVKKHKRRDQIRNSDRYQDYYRRYNAQHREKRLAYMKRYNVYLDNPPTCRECNAAIPFDGRGRPHIRCEKCDPRGWQQARDRKAA